MPLTLTLSPGVAGDNHQVCCVTLEPAFGYLLYLEGAASLSVLLGPTL